MVKERTRGRTHKVVALPTINQPIHHIHNPQPQLQQNVPLPLPTIHLAQHAQIVQKHLTQQRGSPDSRLAHAQRIRLVHLRFKELVDEREEDFAKDRGPRLVVRGREVCGEKGALHGGEGLLADCAAWVEALVCEGFEDGGVVCCPCCKKTLVKGVKWPHGSGLTFASLQMTLLNEIWHPSTHLKHNTHRRATPHNNHIVLRLLGFRLSTSPRSLIVQLFFSCPGLCRSRELVQQRNSSLVVISCDTRGSHVLDERKYVACGVSYARKPAQDGPEVGGAGEFAAQGVGAFAAVCEAGEDGLGAFVQEGFVEAGEGVEEDGRADEIIVLNLLVSCLCKLGGELTLLALRRLRR